MPNKQALADEAEQKIREIEESLNTGKVLPELIFSDTPVKSFYQYWAKNLEILARAGRYKKPISTICAHISRKVTELGFPEKVAYVRQSLQFKYKDESRISDDDDVEKELEDVAERRKISSKDLAPIDQKYLKMLLLEQKAIDKLVDKILTEKLSLTSLPKKSRKEQEELMLRTTNIIKSTMQMSDGRTDVPLQKQFLFFHARTQVTLGNTYDMFVKHLKLYNQNFTPKQVTKISEGRVSRILLLYEPKSRQDAMNVGFYGMPCDSCGSYRCHAKYDENNKRDRLFCYHCEEWSDLKTMNLPGAR